MTATPEEIAAEWRDAADEIVKWLNASVASVGGTPLGGVIAAARDLIDAETQAIERQAAEIERLRSIIGDTVWCEACGSVVPLDDPACDCIQYGNPESRRLTVYDAGAIAKIAELRAEIERLRAGGCARDQGLTQYCAEAVGLAAEIERLRAATQWRPIDDEARNGEPYELLTDNGRVEIGYWHLASAAAARPDIGKRFPWAFIDTTQDTGWNGMQDGIHGPTHYRPLRDATPPPPAADTMETGNG